MPEDDIRDIAYDNRARIEGLEREMDRQRQRTHELYSQLTTVSLLAERIARIADELQNLGNRFDILARRAIERPTVTGWQALMQFGALLVAVAALALASGH